MLASIRTQLVLVLIALVTLLLLQSYIARENQAALIKGMTATSTAVVDVSLVKELERDVLDLQRNVLIFKENASQSAVTRLNVHEYHVVMWRVAYLLHSLLTIFGNIKGDAQPR